MIHVWAVVNEEDLLDEVVWTPVDNAVHGPDQGGPGLVVEADNHAGWRQVAQEAVGSFTPGNGNRKKNANLIVETNAEYTCEM